ncbi:MAG: CBS domain-containing protein [Bacteroidota bacterium]
MNINLPVSKIMTTELITVAETDTLERIKPLIKRRSVHHLPVEDEDGQLLGIISSEDFARSNYYPIPEDKLLARHIMTVSVESVNHRSTIGEVLEKFLTNRYRALPVLDDDQILVGIVTPFDLMQLLSAHLETERMDGK